MESGQQAIAYIRVSVVGDRAARGRFESPELQRESIDGWAQRNGINIVREIQDLNRSGGTLTRPGLTEALSIIKAGEAHGIVVARSDRASRRAVDGLGLIDKLADIGGWIAAVDGTIDTTDSSRKMATTMFLAASERELDRFREQSAEVHRRAIIEKGRHMGPAPFGYIRNADGRLVPDSELSAWAVHVFRRRAEGAGWVTISRELEHVRQRNGRRVTPHLLRRMVARRVYVGEANHGPHVMPGAHAALVDEALFAAANRSAPAVRSSPRVARAHEESVLRGLLRCAGCRYVLKRMPQRAGAPSRWVCRSVITDRSATHDCMAPARLTSRQAEQAEDVIVSEFFSLASGVAAEKRDDSPDVEVLRSAANDAEVLLDELSSLEVRRQLGAQRWTQLVADARASVDEARRELAEASARATRVGLADRATLEDAWAGMTVIERQEALGSIIQAVMVDGGDAPLAERLHVIPIWTPVDIPRRGSLDYVVRPWRTGKN